VFDYVNELLEALPPPYRTDDVRMGLHEALGNAIIHGALGVGSRDVMGLDTFLLAVAEAETEPERRVVYVAIEQRGAGMVRIVIDDCGPGFDHERALVRPGRGLAFVESGFTHAEYQRGGRRLVLDLGGATCSAA